MRRSLRASALIAGFATAPFLLAAAAAAQSPEPAFLDDRSSPEALVRSLYNAVNRHEYARAWDYFSMPPAASYDAYVAGYEDTAEVDVEIGPVASEGAAGSIYFEVPVILRVVGTDGGRSAFSGCYVVRQVNGAIQDPPYTPMRIESGTFAMADTDWPEFPPDCAEDAAAADPLAQADARAVAIFAAAYDGICDPPRPELAPFGGRPDVFPLTSRYAYEGSDDPVHPFRLYQFFCWLGAYNAGYVYYIADEYGEVRQVQFAEPVLDFDYADQEQTKLQGMAMLGFSATDALINPEYDAAAQALTTHGSWRGLSDAFDEGTWVFDGGGFRLDHYVVDPTFDGAITPTTVVENGQPAFVF